MGSTDAGGVSFRSLGAENYTSYKNRLDAKGTNIKIHQLRKAIMFIGCPEFTQTSKHKHKHTNTNIIH